MTVALQAVSRQAVCIQAGALPLHPVQRRHEAVHTNSMTDEVHIGALLRAIREEQGISQPTLYRKADGVSIATIAAVERGVRRPSASMLEGWCHALGVDPERFEDYRHAKLRDELDEAKVGRAAAVSKFREIERALRPSVSPAAVAKRAAGRIQAQQSEARQAPKKKAGKGRAA